jgi:phosphate-selective porin OprO/OprP
MNKIYLSSKSHRMKLIKLIFLLFIIAWKISAIAQVETPLTVFTKKEKGIEVVQKDSLFSLRFQFRMQNRAGYMSKLNDSEDEFDFTPESFEFRVRRLRMAMRGFVYSSKFTYYVQLSFSRGDMDWESTATTTLNTSPNIVRDAVVFYEPKKGLKFGFGQTKLPGNRQRVVSSGNLQFFDRSIVNAVFTIDRDFGFFATLDKNYFRLKGSITSGEGRNSNRSDKGLNYTGRVEFLPFGKFTGENEDCEGDLAREAKPKLVLAAGYNFNALAARTGGTIGNDLYERVNMQNLHADVLFKYKGFSFLQEYCNRIVDRPVTENSDGLLRAVYNGFGSNSQLSYLFKNNIEIAARYSFVAPNKNIYDNQNFSGINEKRQEHIHLGVTKYLYGHRLKIQGNVLYQISKDLKNVSQKNQVGAVFQIEMGI